MSEKNIVGRYLTAREKWVAAGKPQRTKDEVAQVFEICSGKVSGEPCEMFQWHNKRLNLGRCKKCGCQLNLGKALNKLHWATEQCPLRRKKRRWDAKIVMDKDGNWVENPNWLKGQTPAITDITPNVDTKAPPEPPPEPKLTKQQQRAIDRQKRKKERQERREKRQRDREALGVPCDPIDPPPNTDNLKIYDSGSRLFPVSPLRNLWYPAPGAFLICGGPSLNKLDLTRLDDPRIMSLGVNNVAGCDPTEKFSGHVMLNPGIMKIAPVQKLKNQIRVKENGVFYWGKLRLRDCPNVWGFSRESRFNASTFLEDQSAHWGGEFDGHRKILYTPYVGLRLLVHLGIKNIFLLGVDHVMEAGQGYAFPQGRTKGAAKSNNAHYQIVNDAMTQLRPFFEAKGITVYNCNKESHCPAWDYLPYEEALKVCTSMIPPHPLDLEGWYEKAKDQNGEPRSERLLRAQERIRKRTMRENEERELDANS